MSHYRDDLAAAHRRIALLEEQLGMRAPAMPARRRGVPLVGWVIAGSGIFLFLGVFGAVTGLFRFGRDLRVEPPAATATTTAPAPATPRLYASWYTQSGVLPTLVDVNGDGTKDIVGLFWKSGQEDTPLYVAAVDGKTFELAWSAGPYPSQWNSTRTHLAVVGAKVLVTDSQETLRVLDLFHGHELHVSEKIPGGITEACALGDGTARAILRRAGTTSEWPHERRLFDVDRLTFEPLRAGTSCPSRYDTCAPGKAATPACSSYGALHGAPKDATTTPSFYVTKTMREGKLAVAVGSKSGGSSSGREAPIAVGYATNASVSSWRQPLVVEGDEMHFGSAQTELRDNTFVTFYPTKAGPWRVVARDPARGTVQWSELVPGSHEGSYAAAFGIDADRVLVIMNQTLHVFDAATGKHLASLDAGTI